MMKCDIFWDAEKEKTYYTLLEEVNFVYKEGDCVIPKGFVSDSGTIPQFAWSRINPYSAEFLKSWFIHDYCYSKR